MTTHRGPTLPYSLVAGVTPWGDGWVVASAKVHGSTIGPETPRVFSSFDEILSEKPSFDVVVVNAPIGYPDGEVATPRRCELDARVLLGRRGASIHNPPPRSVLSGDVAWYDAGLDVVTATLLPRYAELSVIMSPFRQRIVYEGHPELSFFQMNQDHPLTRSKNIEPGRDERVDLLHAKLPGSESILYPEGQRIPRKHLFDAAALLWTARRVFGRAAKRVPVEPEWDSEGLRMEIVF